MQCSRPTCIMHSIKKPKTTSDGFWAPVSHFVTLNIAVHQLIFVHICLLLDCMPVSSVARGAACDCA